jgi:glycosyltransferase involved in cell wall biosynthesis
MKDKKLSLVPNNASQKKNVLMVAYLFPPLGGSGALRPLKLAKYLPEFGWRPLILTVNNPDWYYARDPELLNELSPETLIFRSSMVKAAWIYRMFNPFRIRRIDRWIRKFLLHPDEQIGWLPFACRKAFDVVRKHRVRAVYSTSGPLTDHLVAYFIKKKFGIPWIAEFRDEWFEAPNLQLPTKWHKNIHLRLERKVVLNADTVVAMAPTFNRFLRKHSNAEKKFVTLTAGYDPLDFVPDETATQTLKDANTFLTVYTGLIYDSFRPNGFIQAVSQLIADGSIPKDEVKILFVGSNRPDGLDRIDEFGICEFVNFLPRKQVLKVLHVADVLLLLLSKERGVGVIPSKTFEYLAVSKPILALVPENSDAAKIVQKSGSGLVADFGDVGKMQTAYLELYQRWKSNKNHSTGLPPAGIGQYNQRNISGKLADLLNSCAVG